MSTLVNFTAYGDEGHTAPSSADHWEWDFGDGFTATTYMNTATHVYLTDGVYQVTVSAYIAADPYDPYVQCVATNIINVCTLFSGSFTYSASGLAVTFDAAVTGSPAFSYSYYYYDFDDSGYAYAVESNTGTAPSVTHSYTGTSATPYTPTLVCKNGGRVVDFGPMSGGEVDFSTGGLPLLTGTAVVLSGPSLNHLTVVDPGDYTEGADKITLNSGITSGYYVQLLYVDSSSGYNQSSSAYAIDILLPTNGLSVGLTPSGIAECYNNGITFTPYVFGGTPPYTYDWNFDSTGDFGDTSADGTWVTVAGVETKISTSSTPGEVIYNAADVGITNIATVTLTVTDAALLSSTATAILTFDALPAVYPSGYSGFSRRYVSNSNVGALFTRVLSVTLGTTTAAGHSYLWEPVDDLDSTVIAQPTCVPSVASRKYTETVTRTENGASCIEYVGCVNSADCYVNTPSCTLGAVSLSSSLGTCLKAISIKINSVSPAAEGLALIVERVAGASGTVANVGVSGTLPAIVDYTASPACSFTTAGYPGGILLLDSPYRTFNASNRVAYKITQATTFPLYITALDPVCSATSSITHDYRVRLIDVAGVVDASVTEAMMTDNSRASLAVSNDITLAITGVDSCLSSATIAVSPVSGPYYYSETLTFSATVSGSVAPLTYSWTFDGLGNFGGSGYSYEFVGGTSASSASPQVRFLGPVSAPNRIARVGLTVHDSSNGGTGVDIVATNLDVTLEYIAPCVVSCSASVPTTAIVGSSVSFSASAPTTGCDTSVTWDWDFGDSSSHSSSQNPTHTYSGAGTYTWILTATASSTELGTTTCTRSGSIVVGSACTILSCGVATDSPAAPAVGCYCATLEEVPFVATYTTTGTCGTPTFTWNFGDGNTGSGQSTTHVYSTRNTTYTWGLTVNIGGVTCSTSGQVKTCTLAECSDYLGGGCFVAGTLVSMADGTKKAIEDVRIGDKIIGMDTDGQVVADVLDTLVHDNYSEFVLWQVACGAFTMIMTPDHKVWVEEQQDYIEVSRAIENGFTAKTLSGAYPWVLLKGGHFADTVFNLTTSTRNYFANSVLVSNMKPTH